MTMTTVTLPNPQTSLQIEVRRGPAYWISGYRTMLRWQLASLRTLLPLLTGIQILVGAGFVLGIALLFDDISPTAALYVSSGAPVMNLLMVGLLLGPQLVAEQKAQHSYDFLQALPVPRTMTALAWYTVTLIGSLPAVVMSLLVAYLRYGITFTVSPALVAAVLLTAFTGTMLGYALGHALPNPMTIQLAEGVLRFVVFGLSPILFPPEQLPGWLAALSWWLPFRHMAVIVRDSLAPQMVADAPISYVLVAIWGLVGIAIAAWALGRRR
jgi:ABC-2 type transport system permease protein